MDDAPRVLESLNDLQYERLLNFFVHWDDLRGDRSAPRPDEFDVLDLPDLLKFIAVFQVRNDHEEIRTKFLGQAIVDLIGGDRTGDILSDKADDEASVRLMEALNLVASTSRPVVDGPLNPGKLLMRASLVQTLSLPLVENGAVTQVISLFQSAAQSSL